MEVTYFLISANPAFSHHTAQEPMIIGFKNPGNLSLSIKYLEIDREFFSSFKYFSICHHFGSFVCLIEKVVLLIQDLQAPYQMFVYCHLI